VITIKLSFFFCILVGPLLCDGTEGVRQSGVSRARNRARHRRRVVATTCQDMSVNSAPWSACRLTRGARVAVLSRPVPCSETGPETARQSSLEQNTAPTPSTEDNNNNNRRSYILYLIRFFVTKNIFSVNSPGPR